MRTAIAAFLLLLPVAQGAGSRSGHWVGSIQVPGNDVAIELDLFEDQGVLDGTFSNPAQHLKGLPLSNFAESEGLVSFQVRGSARHERVFNGTFSEDGQTFSGTYSQLGYDLHFELLRDGEVHRETRFASPAVTKEVEGRWSAEAGALRVALTIANQPDGTAQATILNVSEGLDIPVSKVTLDGSILKLDVPAVGGVFAGEIAKDGTQIAGTYTDGASNVELIFRRSESKEAR